MKEPDISVGSMNPTVRRKLVGILGLLSSDHAGERAAAGLLATRLLRTAGITWSDVIPEKSDQAGPASVPSRSRSSLIDWLADLAVCQRNIAALSAWEQNFVRCLAAITTPSRKQRASMREIADGLRARGRA